MTIKILALQLSGKIKSVEKVETARDKLYADYQEFLKVNESEELREYQALDQFLRSEVFQTERETIRKLQFKGSKEYNQLKEYEQLRKNRHIKQYFKLKDSAALKRYDALSHSDKIREYRALVDYLEEGDYRKVKMDMKHQVFKGSPEEKRLTEYNRLIRSAGVKAYFELHDSEKLKAHSAFCQSGKLKNFFDLRNLPDKDKQKKRDFRALKNDPEIVSHLKFEKSKKLRLYHETADSYHLKRLEELKTTVESNEFKDRVRWLRDLKKFEKSDAYKKEQRFRTLKADDDVRFYLNFEKSALLKNYYDSKDSLELKRYQDLKEEVSSEAFHHRREYLEDSKKWEKTDSYAKEQRFLEMKQLPRFINYFKYKDSPDFDFFKRWELRFKDDFSSPLPDPLKWKFIYPMAEMVPGQNYAMPGDLHILTDGYNVKTGTKLIIETRKEKRRGLIWQLPAGFVPAEFDYTSGMISSIENFWQGDGILEAKVKFNPVKEVVSTLYLQSENEQARIHLLEMGARNRMGISAPGPRGKIKMEGLDITGLKRNCWHLFSLNKSGGYLIWKINDTELLRLPAAPGHTAMRLTALNLVVNEIPGNKLPVTFEIDWIRYYRKK